MEKEMENCLIFPTIILWGILILIWVIISIIYWLFNWKCDLDDLDEDRREYH